MFAADYRCLWLTGVTARPWAAGPCRRGGIVPRARTVSVSAGRDWARALCLCVLPGRPERARRVSGGLPDHRRSLCSAVFLGSLSGVAELWVGVDPAAGSEIVDRRPLGATARRGPSAERGVQHGTPDE